MFYWKFCKNILFIANGWLPPKIQTVFLERQRKLMDGSEGFPREINNCSKAMLMSNNPRTKKSIEL